MAFNIRLLDKLSYDEAELILLDYIEDVIEAFVESEPGKIREQENPDEVGEWIGVFIETAYLYGEMTLAKMTKADVQVVMEQILPAKLTLAEPSEVEDAIPDLVAFWTFLKQEYKLRSAGAIAKYLSSIEGKFTDWMFDPNRGGFAKQFVLQGLEAGYDMQSQEGMEAFQKVYNDRIATDPSARLKLPGGMMLGGIAGNLPGNLPSNLSGNVVDLTGRGGEMLAPVVAPPDDIKQMFEVLGLELPPEGELVDTEAFAAKMLIALEGLDEAGRARLNAIEFEEEPEVNPSAVPVSGMAAELRMLQADLTVVELSEEQKALLKATEINEDGPGSILQDFQMLLDAIGSKGIPVSAARHQFALKLLREFNGKLANPNDLDLKRPTQKSFPSLNGLYLLLRATGLVRIEAKGKTFRMVLNPEIYDSWQQLNPAERYFTLLEAWLIRAHPEMVGEERSLINEGTCALRNWPEFAAQKKRTFAQYNEQERLSYWPGFHNLNLMEMFGFLKITHGKPGKGKGWRMKGLEVLPLGEAIMPLCRAVTLAADLMFASETDPTLPFTDFQPALQPYFPEWQESLAVPANELKPGRYIFKVSMEQHTAWRKLAIASDTTLEDLSALILDAFEFADYEHLDAFTYKNQVGRNIRVMHPMAFDGDLFTDQIQLGRLPLNVGDTLEYVFDLGACWEFKVQLEAIESDWTAPQPIVQISASRKPQLSPVPEQEEFPGKVLEIHGEAPPQYPDEEDW